MIIVRLVWILFILFLNLSPPSFKKNILSDHSVSAFDHVNCKLYVNGMEGVRSANYLTILHVSALEKKKGITKCFRIFQQLTDLMGSLLNFSSLKIALSSMNTLVMPIDPRSEKKY